MAVNYEWVGLGKKTTLFDAVCNKGFGDDLLTLTRRAIVSSSSCLVIVTDFGGQSSVSNLIHISFILTALTALSRPTKTEQFPQVFLRFLLGLCRKAMEELKLCLLSMSLVPRLFPFMHIIQCIARKAVTLNRLTSRVGRAHDDNTMVDSTVTLLANCVKATSDRQTQ